MAHLLHVCRRAALALGVILVLMCVAVPVSAHGRYVLPANQQVGGYSLTDMARKTALFNTSDHSASLYPSIPAQMLYASTTNTFVVGDHTRFYVPLVYADDSPPVVGTFPTSHQRALHYFFDRKQLGGQHYAITVDGHTTPIGRDYLAGPVTTPPLLDGGGRHYVVLAAFLAPLHEGRHTIRISGELSGKLVIDLNGEPFKTDITYTIIVR